MKYFMESITIYPKDKKQATLLKSLLEELKVSFSLNKSDHEIAMTELEFKAKIDKSIEQAHAGQTKKLSKNDQKALLGL
jgi:hypothetical protein